MTVNVNAEAELPIGGGMWGGGSSLIKGDIKLSDIQLQFRTQWCSKHQMTGNPCQTCMQEVRDEIFAILRQPNDGLTIDPSNLPASDPYVDCKNIYHSHNCACFLGHDCDTQCYEYDRLMQEEKDRLQKLADGQMADDENELQPHALFQLAAAAPAPELQSVHERLTALEKDNHALRSLVTKLLEHMPEDDRNSVIVDAVREKIGLEPLPRSETSGSTESVEDS